MKYRKKPVVIEALQVSDSPHLDGDLRIAQIAGWMTGNGFGTFYVHGERRPFGIAIRTLEGEMVASPGDFIIRGVQGEFYPCKPDIFEATYEPAEATS